MQWKRQNMSKQCYHQKSEMMRYIVRCTKRLPDSPVGGEHGSDRRWFAVRLELELGCRLLQNVEVQIHWYPLAFFISVKGHFCIGIGVVQVLLDCYFYSNIVSPTWYWYHLLCPFFCTWLKELAAAKLPSFPQPDSWSVEILSDMRPLSPVFQPVTRKWSKANWWINAIVWSLCAGCPCTLLALLHNITSKQPFWEKKEHTKNKSFKKTHPWGRQLAAPPDFLGPHSQAAWAMPAASSHDLQI